jgi:hypothetical protein
MEMHENETSGETQELCELSALQAVKIFYALKHLGLLSKEKRAPWKKYRLLGN